MFEDLNLQKSLQLAVKTEQLGAHFYERMAKKFADNANIAEIFGILAKDEKVHEAQFTKILETVSAEEGSSNYETDQYLRAIAISEFFAVGNFPKAENINDEADALGAALNLEKSTLLFYKSIGDVLGESEQLNKIIEAEKKHVISLTKIIVTDAKFRNLQDKW